MTESKNSQGKYRRKKDGLIFEFFLELRKGQSQPTYFYIENGRKKFVADTVLAHDFEVAI